MQQCKGASGVTHRLITKNEALVTQGRAHLLSNRSIMRERRVSVEEQNNEKREREGDTVSKTKRKTSEET